MITASKTGNIQCTEQIWPNFTKKRLMKN